MHTATGEDVPTESGGSMSTPSSNDDGQRRRQDQRRITSTQQQDGDDSRPQAELLPREQDRKAIMGCIAAVLNTMFAHQNQPQQNSKVKGKNDKDVGDDSVLRQEASFAFRQDDDTDCPSNRRTRQFQRELLIVSANLLYLTPDHATIFMPNLDIQFMGGGDNDEQAEHQLLLEPFLQSLTSAEESFRCIVLLVFRFLLLSSEGEDKPSGDGRSSNTADSADTKKTIVGYDARVRYAFKSLAVTVLSYWELKEHGKFMNRVSAATRATRKFQALEDAIAQRLTVITKLIQEKAEEDQKKRSKGSLAGGRKEGKSFGQHVVRGLKIGGAGVAAGTLFAITGGLAAPAIAGGIVALTGVGTAASFAVTILMIPAATTIFGVAGGGLVASKMNTRTKGLSEFEIKKVTPGTDAKTDDKASRSKKGQYDETAISPELSRTVCISGWMRDDHDFQRPWGLTPESLTEKHELLCRFCSVYAPSVIPKCRGILKDWKGKEDELWDMLRSAYGGKDPNSLLPFSSGPRQDAALSRDEYDTVDDLIRAMKLPLPLQDDATSKSNDVVALPPPVNLLADILTTNDADDNVTNTSTNSNEAALRSYKAWDYHAEYGGEQYTIFWEKNLLIQLNGSAREFQRDLAKTAAGEALKKTALASLMAAVALPATMLSLTNVIDEKWTLVAERADEAGILLAQSLLNSESGHRPVSLIGFSFGARMIISCLQELARHQNIWEHHEIDVDDIGLTKADSIRRSISRSVSSKMQREAPVYTREPASIIEDVVLMGCPASVTPSSWVACRSVVGGRLVNCYSRNDLILALMYRIKNLTKLLSPLVGIVEVNVPGIENYDVSPLVANHSEYCVAVREILEVVGYDQPRRGSKR